MNQKPIEQAHDTDLRLSMIALARAARRARESAARTGTALIVTRNGAIERIEPGTDPEGAAEANDRGGVTP